MIAVAHDEAVRKTDEGRPIHLKKAGAQLSRESTGLAISLGDRDSNPKLLIQR